jgi:hypothetical protein
MPDSKDVILKHIAALNDRDSDADAWAADAELVAPGGQASGRDDVISFLGVFTEAFPDLRLEHPFSDRMDLLGQLGLLPGTPLGSARTLTMHIARVSTGSGRERALSGCRCGSIIGAP